jgi:hypothetical protein
VEQRERARQLIYTRMVAGLPSSLPARLDALLDNSTDQTHSPLQTLKAPAGAPSPRALLKLTEKLDRIQQTDTLALELSWLNNNLQQTLAQYAWQSSAYRLRQL